jgi:hypothetical protein
MDNEDLKDWGLLFLRDCKKINTFNFVFDLPEIWYLIETEEIKVQLQKTIEDFSCIRLFGKIVVGDYVGFVIIEDTDWCDLLNVYSLSYTKESLNKYVKQVNES